VKEKTKGAIKNGQSRDIGNIGQQKTQNKDKQSKNTIQKTKQNQQMTNTDPTKNR